MHVNNDVTPTRNKPNPQSNHQLAMQIVGKQFAKTLKMRVIFWLTAILLTMKLR